MKNEMMEGPGLSQGNKESRGQVFNLDCPYLEMPPKTSLPDMDLLSSLTDPERVKRLLEENVSVKGRGPYILPAVQNLESMVFGLEISKGPGNKNQAGYRPGCYCLENLHDIEDFEFDLLGHPLIKAVLETIPAYRGQALLLEVMAPFSILAALMDPMDLYPCFEEEPELLLLILQGIADALAGYIRACLKAGCQIISLADPTGSLDLVGQEYFKRFSGHAVAYLMEQCDEYLDGAVMHLCPKLSQALMFTGLALPGQIKLPAGGDDLIGGLLLSAKDPLIHFTGRVCLHIT